MTEILIYIFSTLGALFALLAAIGLVRMRDPYLRISVNTKAATLGVGLLLGAAYYFLFRLFSHYTCASHRYFYFFDSACRCSLTRENFLFPRK